jgi:hypothetical protein
MLIVRSDAHINKYDEPAIEYSKIFITEPRSTSEACILTIKSTQAASVTAIPSETSEEATEETTEEEVIDDTGPEYEEPAQHTAEELFDAEIALIPVNHLRYLADNGWTWCVTSMDLAAEFGYDVSVVGVTYYPGKVIYIADRSEVIRRATIHEFGHALAYQLGDVDETDEFYDIFYAERDNFHDCTSIGDGHEIMNTDEYFASVYQNMILNYDETYADVPRTVEYIERVLSVI